MNKETKYLFDKIIEELDSILANPHIYYDKHDFWELVFEYGNACRDEIRKELEEDS